MKTQGSLLWFLTNLVLEALFIGWAPSDKWEKQRTPGQAKAEADSSAHTSLSTCGLRACELELTSPRILLQYQPSSCLQLCAFQPLTAGFSNRNGLSKTVYQKTLFQSRSVLKHDSKSSDYTKWIAILNMKVHLAQCITCGRYSVEQQIFFLHFFISSTFYSHWIADGLEYCKSIFPGELWTFHRCAHLCLHGVYMCGFLSLWSGYSASAVMCVHI